MQLLSARKQFLIVISNNLITITLFYLEFWLNTLVDFARLELYLPSKFFLFSSGENLQKVFLPNWTTAVNTTIPVMVLKENTNRHDMSSLRSLASSTEAPNDYVTHNTLRQPGSVSQVSVVTVRLVRRLFPAAERGKSGVETDREDRTSPPSIFNA